MLVVNEQLSGIIPSAGPTKMKIVVDGANMEEAMSGNAKQLAMQTAAAHGFGNAGISEFPNPYPLHADTGEPVKDEEAFSPNVRVGGYRAEYVFVQRL
jgi:hypothetical protein